MGNFKFQLGRIVVIECSLEQGVIHARSEYSNSENQYLVRYKSADGRAVEAWWPESALVGA